MEQKQTSYKPNSKVTAGAIAGAITTIVVWLAGEYGGVEVPPEVASAVTVLVTLLVSYFKREAVAAVLLILMLPIAAPAYAQTTVDTLETEAVRSRAFIRGAETQLTKVLHLIDRLDPEKPEVPTPESYPLVAEQVSDSVGWAVYSNGRDSLIVISGPKTTFWQARVRGWVFTDALERRDVPRDGYFATDLDDPAHTFEVVWRHMRAR